MICAVALILLLDSSGSFETEDFDQLVEAHASAFESDEVHTAIQRNGGVVVRMVEFSEQSRAMTEWFLLTNVQESNNFARVIRGTTRAYNGGTFTGRAIDYSINMLNEAPCGDERVIDIVTDGVGAGMPEARDRAIEQEVKINAIGMATRYGDPTDWLRENVVTPGGFVGTADQAGLARALRRKLVTEMTGTYELER